MFIRRVADSDARLLEDQEAAIGLTDVIRQLRVARVSSPVLGADVQRQIAPKVC
jgi:hypothetical protein